MSDAMTITFQWPHLFWLLLVPLAGMIAELTRRVRALGSVNPKILRAEAAPGQLTLTSGSVSFTPTRARVRWRLWLGVALVIAALARPQWGHVEEQVFDQAREILIAVDLSRSMLAPDVAPSRLDRTKLLITSLLERLEGERVGLIVFAGTAFLQSPLSSDYEILREFLPALNPDFLPEGGTNYTALLQTSLEAFGKADAADRFLIILSDGESTVDDWEKLVNPLRERSVRVLSLGIGTAEGAMLPDGSGGFVKDERGAVVLSRLDTSTLEDLARRTGGVYRDASRWVDLAELLRETVEAGQQGEFTEVSRIRRVERFQWLLAPALFALLWSFWREFPVHPRPRTVPLTTSLPPSSKTAANTATVSALLFCGLLIVTVPFAHAAPATNPFAAPIGEIVGRLAAQPQVSATDYAEMAQATLTYGQRLTDAGQTPEPGAIQDALDAVTAGEQLDPKAADWEKLRDELEALQPPEEQEEQQPQDDQQQQQQESDDSSGDQDQQQQEQQEQQQDQQSEQADSQDGSDSPPSQPQDSNSDPKPGEGSENEEQQQPPQSPKASDDSAFGDMQEPPPSPDGDSTDQETQKVGGQPDRRPSGEENPALTVPLQKLEQLKQQDSPAQLYQLMQDPNARPTPKGRDW